MKPIIKVENLSKQYRLGSIGTGTLKNDFKRWWHNIRGKEDPFLKIGETNDRSVKGTSDYTWALKDINFEVMPGEVLGIIGKNGAGKSTLLKILSKVTGPTTGRIDYNGRIGSLLEVGTGFHPELTGRENIFLNGAILGMTKREIHSKLDEIIDFSGCERYIDTPVKRYSSGMTVRLGFAVAAHLEPEILVVDEVLAVGDAEFQKKAIGKMQDVSRNDGRTVLFVSHNMGAVRRMCTKGLLLENGSVDFHGSIGDSVNRYMISNESIQEIDVVKSITYNSPKVVINEVLINNGKQNIVKVKESNNNLEIAISGILLQDLKISLEVRIYDQSDTLLFVYSPELRTGNVKRYTKGNFKIERTIELPKGLMKGVYRANISLTNPSIEGFVDFTNAIIIESEGIVTSKGFLLEYTKGHGLIMLH